MEVSTMAVQLSRSPRVNLFLHQTKTSSIWTSKNTSKYSRCSTRKILEKFILTKCMILLANLRTLTCLIKQTKTKIRISVVKKELLGLVDKYKEHNQALIDHIKNLIIMDLNKSSTMVKHFQELRTEKKMEVTFLILGSFTKVIQ